MKKSHKLLGVALLIYMSALPAVACTGCGGRFPPGINIRLMKLKYQKDSVYGDSEIRRPSQAKKSTAASKKTATAKKAPKKPKPKSKP